MLVQTLEHLFIHNILKINDCFHIIAVVGLHVHAHSPLTVLPDLGPGQHALPLMPDPHHDPVTLLGVEYLQQFLPVRL